MRVQCRGIARQGNWAGVFNVEVLHGKVIGQAGRSVCIS